MSQSTQQTSKQLWQMQSRNIYTGMPIFKMKLHYQLPRNNQPQQKPHILFPITKAKKVVEYTSGLKTLKHIYNFQHDPHALQIMSIDHNQAESKTSIVAGSTDGMIMCQPLINESKQQSTSQHQQQTKFILNNNSEDKNPNEVFINEIMDLGKGKMVNCFNNGTLAFWDLVERKRVHTMERVHTSYLYKLRQVQERLISCGHDGMTVVTDLLKLKPIIALQNADSCWCSYPINYNVISSVGLFRRVNLWDIRTRSLIHSIPLQNSQSSFITAFDHNNLIFGDGNILKKCDLRTMSCNTFTSQQMLLSAEHIIVDRDGGYVCGRKNEVCRFEAVGQLCPQIKAAKTVFDPFNPEYIMPSRIINNDFTNANPEILRHFLAQMLVGNDPEQFMDEFMDDFEDQQQQQDQQDWELQQGQQQQQRMEELYQQQEQMMDGEDSELMEMEEQGGLRKQEQLCGEQSVQQQKSQGQQMLMNDQSQQQPSYSQQHEQSLQSSSSEDQQQQPKNQ